MNTGEYISFQITVYIFFGYMLNSGNFTLFSKLAASIYSPTNSTLGFIFPHILPGTSVISWLLDDSHSDRCKAISHGSFKRHFSDDEYLFMCLLAKGIFFDIELYKLFVYFEY